MECSARSGKKVHNDSIWLFGEENLQRVSHSIQRLGESEGGAFTKDVAEKARSVIACVMSRSVPNGLDLATMTAGISHLNDIGYEVTRANLDFTRFDLLLGPLT